MAEENTPKKPGPGTKGISELVEFMETNNKSSAKIEKDGRNTRRHLLEIKKLNTSMGSAQKRIRFFPLLTPQLRLARQIKVPCQFLSNVGAVCFAKKPKADPQKPLDLQASPNAAIWAKHSAQSP